LVPDENNPYWELKHVCGEWVIPNSDNYVYSRKDAKSAKTELFCTGSSVFGIRPSVEKAVQEEAGIFMKIKSEYF
jgi:hypothetical protein